MKFGKIGDKGINWVTTSHFEKTEASAAFLLNKKLLPINNLREHTHSHPNKYQPNPSLRDRKFVNSVHQQNSSVYFLIYATGSKTYGAYDEDGRIDSFLSK